MNQVMPPLDPEMARLVERYLVKHGVQLELNDAVAAFRQAPDGTLEVQTTAGKSHPAEIVILAIGVRPETELAKAAGLEIGQRGGIRVDEHMRTSDPHILAVGDAVEVKDFVTGPVDADPARRAGQPAGPDRGRRDCRARLALPRHAGHVDLQDLRGRNRPDGRRARSRSRRPASTDFEKVYLYQNSHAGYYPGAKMLAIKVLFRKSDGRLLGRAGARRGRRRQADRLVRDGHPDAGDHLRPGGGRAVLRAAVRQREGPGELRRDGRPATSCAATCRRCTGTAIGGGFLLDVRNPPELAVESVPGAVNIPLPQLRARLGELPRDREILVICRSAVRAYYATRILLQNGFTAKNISGGMLARSHRAE